ncbi:MAG: UPF0149 family protein [Gammaproteobacteria bacterium]|jgi:hypothetical protein|nr:UPF0149 family protein [Gammaproteobacteria bacterium]MBT5217195.1 UPF0149 family protein [Gammaproteobacteria bacterium]MBT5541618.1 UPF0149 family protein [Gammaproteobacteria bacterium]MDG2435143.1 UPF0149 family protein [Gammaproteobacteria bacterium]
MNYKELEALRKSASDTISIAEYHGNICSYLCCSIDSFDDLLPSEKSDDQSSVSIQVLEFRNALLDLIEETSNALNSSDLPFLLLLPNDNESLEKRTTTLSMWCQGFIDGLGLIVSENSSDIGESSMSLLTEIIEDFSQISTLHIQSKENDEEEELAFIELLEYVRVSTELIFEEIKIKI